MKNIVARGIAALTLCVFSGHCAAVTTPVVAAAAQEGKDGKAITSATVAGTWNLTVMSHQVALVLEQDGTKITGTLMMPDTDLKVEGTFTDRVITLAAKELPASAADGAEGNALKITGTFQDDGSLAGELSHGTWSSKWTAERLKERRK